MKNRCQKMSSHRNQSSFGVKYFVHFDVFDGNSLDDD